mmetsp:Transcript_27790/g.44745  ORF Transcript_27790/g.44745 Transcript_27790/m.44745 type:complete len:148 (-) Transcript_27790:530-973(-)
MSAKPIQIMWKALEKSWRLNGLTDPSLMPSQLALFRRRPWMRILARLSSGMGPKSATKQKWSELSFSSPFGFALPPLLLPASLLGLYYISLLSAGQIQLTIHLPAEAVGQPQVEHKPLQEEGGDCLRPKILKRLKAPENLGLDLLHG